MELTKQVEEALQKPVQSSPEQARQIATAVKLVDELVRQGLMELPQYRLAHNAVPAKPIAFGR
jgi:hypothetical protein